MKGPFNLQWDHYAAWGHRPFELVVRLLRLDVLVSMRAQPLHEELKNPLASKALESWHNMCFQCKGTFKKKKGLKEKKIHLHKAEAVALQSRDSRLFLTVSVSAWDQEGVGLETDTAHSWYGDSLTCQQMSLLDKSYLCIASGGFIPTRSTRWGPVCMSSSSYKAYHKVHVGWSDLSTVPLG